MFVFMHLFLTFSAALGIARTSSALYSLARKFALRFSAALGIARTSSALHSLARKFAAAWHSPSKLGFCARLAQTWLCAETEIAPALA